ncbi:MAG: hypothetical protein D3914_15380 [Candidatus Electrothrix sp. LOE2]|nr:hypothetical protein [Candidatus Electrothrix sp. LOE2]
MPGRRLRLIGWINIGWLVLLAGFGFALWYRNDSRYLKLKVLPDDKIIKIYCAILLMRYTIKESAVFIMHMCT